MFTSSLPFISAVFAYYWFPFGSWHVFRSPICLSVVVVVLKSVCLLFWFTIGLYGLSGSSSSSVFKMGVFSLIPLGAVS